MNRHPILLVVATVALTATSREAAAYTTLPNLLPQGRPITSRAALPGEDVTVPVTTATTATTTASRRNFFEQCTTLTFLGVGAWMTPLPNNPIVVVAVDEPPPTQEAVKALYDDIRYELENPQGGVAYMQGRIDALDFEGLMEFTKSYDLELRKLRMGKAKKLLQSKEVKEEATGYANAVTFDLIGINRNSRKGQENQEGANKYLQELRDDVNKFLSLQNTIETEG